MKIIPNTDQNKTGSLGPRVTIEKNKGDNEILHHTLLCLLHCTALLHHERRLRSQLSMSQTMLSADNVGI